MTDCTDCGRDTGMGAYHAPDDDKPRCKVCHRKHCGLRKPKGDRITPDDYTKNRESHDHKATESRRRVLDNAGGGARL